MSSNYEKFFILIQHSVIWNFNTSRVAVGLGFGQKFLLNPW
jgi:hypothetical protein